MRKAARHSDGEDSLNPRCWRGKRLHHHGGGVCWLFVLLWMDSWHHGLIVCKKWYKNNLKMRLTALFFDPPRRAPHLFPYSILSIFSFSLKIKRPPSFRLLSRNIAVSLVGLHPVAITCWRSSKFLWSLYCKLYYMWAQDTCHRSLIRLLSSLILQNAPSHTWRILDE